MFGLRQMIRESRNGRAGVRPRRKVVRAQKYHYSSPGAYFVTICVQGRRPILAKIGGEGHELTRPGRIVEAAWHDLPNRFHWVDIDSFVVMPNHIHGIVIFNATSQEASAGRVEFPDRSGVGEAGVMNHAPTRRRDRGDGYAPIALGEVIRAFKAVATRSIRTAGLAEFAWQRNYYEHIIRSDQSLERIREYIEGNSGKWAEDRYYVDSAVRV